MDRLYGCRQHEVRQGDLVALHGLLCEAVHICRTDVEHTAHVPAGLRHQQRFRQLVQVTSVIGVSLTRIAPCFCSSPFVICIRQHLQMCTVKTSFVLSWFQLCAAATQSKRIAMTVTYLVCSLILSNLRSQQRLMRRLCATACAGGCSMKKPEIYQQRGSSQCLHIYLADTQTHLLAYYENAVISDHLLVQSRVECFTHSQLRTYRTDVWHQTVR